jgi:hypothetical protein
METKVCSKCKKEKKVCDFYKDKTKKDGLTSNCKFCNNITIKKYKEKNTDKVRQSKKKEYLKNIERYRSQNQKWRGENPKHMSEYSKIYYVENKEELLEKQKNYYESNKNTILKKSQEYVKDNLEKTSKYQKKYRDNNKEILRQYKQRYNKKRRQTDIIFKLKCNISHRIRQYLKNKTIIKNLKTFEIVGCSPEYLKEYLEKQFVSGMTWKSRNSWHIDHIIPLSSAKNEEELLKLCHYTNLQPLWASENIKKSNKIL